MISINSFILTLDIYVLSTGDTSFPYYPRPGIVLDDPEYKPGDAFHHRPILTAPPPRPGGGEIFDVTVSAVQGPGGANTGQPFVYPGNDTNLCYEGDMHYCSNFVCFWVLYAINYI